MGKIFIHHEVREDKERAVKVLLILLGYNPQSQPVQAEDEQQVDGE